MNNIIIRSNNLNKLTKYQNYFNRKGLQSFLTLSDETHSLRVVGLTNLIFSQFTKNFHLSSFPALALVA